MLSEPPKNPQKAPKLSQKPPKSAGKPGLAAKPPKPSATARLAPKPLHRPPKPSKKPSGPSRPSGSPKPTGPRSKGPATGLIQNVVILFKENHAFDNYFGTFPGANGAPMAHSPNPPPKDPDHRHKAWLSRNTTAVRQQFLQADIPAYFAYAKQFTLCDNYFTDVAGPSTPNHLMVIAADSPIIDNPSGNPVYDLASLPASLDAAGLTWGNYGGYAFDMIKGLVGRPKQTSEQFAKDAAAGKLPTVSWVYAPHALSEHPPDPPDKGANPPVGNVTNGMQWSVDQVNAIVQGGLWPKTAIFITWDDWGGWWDHVNPPQVEKWTDGTQFRYGTRVGCLVLSPYAKAGYISHVLHSHVSLIKFCEDTFSLPTLNARDAAADGMTDCFDFTQKPLAVPPVNPQ